VARVVCSSSSWSFILELLLLLLLLFGIVSDCDRCCCCCCCEGVEMSVVLPDFAWDQLVEMGDENVCCCWEDWVVDAVGVGVFGVG